MVPWWEKSNSPFPYQRGQHITSCDGGGLCCNFTNADPISMFLGALERHGSLKIVAESRQEVVFGGPAGPPADSDRFQEAHAE